MADDINNLILQVKGREDVEALRKAIEAEEDALRKLIKTHDVHDTAVQASGAKILDLTAKMKDAEKAAGLAGNKLAGSGQSMLQFGRIVQDFQAAGIAGVVNNFEGMASALGMGAGIAGAAQLAGVAIYALTPKIKELWAAFTAGDIHRFSGAIDDVKKRLEEMEKKDHKIKFDYAAIDEMKRRIDKIQESLATFDSLAKQRTNIQEQVAKAVQDVIVEQAGGSDEEGGAENLRRLIKAAAGADMDRADPRSGKLAELQRSLKGMEAIVKDKSAAVNPERRLIAIEESARLRDAIEALDKDIGKTTDQHIKELVADASKGIDRARRRLIEIFDENEELFRKGEGTAEGARPVAGGFRFGLEQAGADIVKQKAKEQDFIEEQRRMARLDKELKEKADAAKKKRDAETEALNRQGLDSELAGAAARAKAKSDREKEEAAQTKRQVTDQLKDEDAAIMGGGYARMAQGLMADVQARGGAKDQFGRFQKMDQDQIFDYVQRTIDAALKQKNPFMMGDQRRDVATRATSLAKEDLTKQMIGVGGTQAATTAKLLQVSEANFAGMEHLRAFVMNLARRAETLERKSQARARTAGKRS